MDEIQPQTPPQDVPAPPEAVAVEVRESAPAPWRVRDLFLFLAFVPIGFLVANILAGLGYALILAGAPLATE